MVESGPELRGLHDARMKRALYILSGQADLVSSAKRANFAINENHPNLT